MRPTAFRFFLLLWLCLPALSSAAPAPPKPALLHGKVEQLERRIIELEQARKEDSKELRESLEKARDKVDARIEKHENAMKEGMKQETERTKDWVTVVDKRVEWSVYIITALICIMTLVGGYLILKSHFDSRRVQREAEKHRDDIKNILDESKGHHEESGQLYSNIESILAECERLRKEIQGVRLDIDKPKMDAATSGIKLEPGTRKAAERSKGQEEDLVAKHTGMALLAEEDGDWNKALVAWEEVLKSDPNSLRALFGRAYAFGALAITVSDRETRTAYLHESADTYNKIVDLDPSYISALNNWGNTLSQLAKPDITPDPKQRKALLKLACKKYKTALDINKNYYTATLNWGVRLADLAKPDITPRPKERKALLELACKKYEVLWKQNKDKPEFLYQWGNILGDLAKPEITPNPNERKALLELACKKFEAALDIKKDYYEALHNEGITLSELADPSITPESNERDTLLELASNKFKTALEIEKNNPAIHNALGTTSILRANISIAHGDEKGAKDYLTEAKLHSLNAETITPGSGAYNLACVASLLDQEDDCRHWLQTCRKHCQSFNCEQLRKDNDFNPMRDKEWFETFTKEVCGDE